MQRGILCATIFALLVECPLGFGAPVTSSSDMSRSRIFLRESLGALGCGTGCAAVVLPATLLAYLFSGGDVAPVIAAEGVCLGLGSAAGAYWTGRSLSQPAKFWPALGLAFLPEVGTGLVMVLTRKGADLTDPLIMGCCAGAVIASPILATVGANLGRRPTADGTSSRFRVVPELRARSEHRSGPGPGITRVSTGLGFRLSF